MRRRPSWWCLRAGPWPAAVVGRCLPTLPTFLPGHQRCRRIHKVMTKQIGRLRLFLPVERRMPRRVRTKSRVDGPRPAQRRARWHRSARLNRVGPRIRQFRPPRPLQQIRSFPRSRRTLPVRAGPKNGGWRPCPPRRRPSARHLSGRRTIAGWAATPLTRVGPMRLRSPCQTASLILHCCLRLARPPPTLWRPAWIRSGRKSRTTRSLNPPGWWRLRARVATARRSSPGSPLGGTDPNPFRPRRSPPPADRRRRGFPGRR